MTGLLFLKGRNRRTQAKSHVGLDGVEMLQNPTADPVGPRLPQNCVCIPFKEAKRAPELISGKTKPWEDQLDQNSLEKRLWAARKRVGRTGSGETAHVQKFHPPWEL